jgi:hypothetical protein
MRNQPSPFFGQLQKFNDTLRHVLLMGKQAPVSTLPHQGHLEVRAIMVLK